MHQRGILLFCLLAVLYTGIHATWPRSVPEPPAGEVCGENNTEALFACGRPIRIGSVEQFQLELIPGMNAELSEKIINQRQEIIDDIGRHRIKERALETVDDIGRARSKNFGKYLSFE